MSETERNRAQRAGYLACCRGISLYSCPYAAIEKAEAWAEGWRRRSVEAIMRHEKQTILKRRPQGVI